MAKETLPAINKANTIRAYLEGQKKQLALAVPKHLPVDRLLRVAMTSIQQTPKLLECTPVSLLRCVMTCAQLGLEPDQFLGQAYLVPFWNSKKSQMEAQLIPGYRGYISLARRSGEVQSVSSQVAYTNDHFLLEYGINEKLEHRPVEGDRGKPRGAYVIFKYKDGGYSFDYMSAGDIEKIRARSKAGDSGPWVTDWDEMAKKTVIKRHSKLAPLSVEFQKAVALEDRAYSGESQAGIFDDLNGNVIDMEEGDKDVEALVKQFDEAMPKDVDQGQLKVFLTKAADTFKMSEDEVKAEAMKDLNGFLGQFKNWLRVENAKKEKGEPSDKDPIREQYINLKGPGFSTWVYKNKDYIRGLGGVHEVEIKAKWQKLYPKDTYPLDKQESPATGEDALPEGGTEEGPSWEGEDLTETEDQGSPPPATNEEQEKVLHLVPKSKLDSTSGRLCVPCPKIGNHAAFYDPRCKECERRQGCPTFKEYDA